MELPAVECAGEVIDAAVRVEGHAVRAVRADVVERFDASIVLARDQDRLVTDLEGEVVAGFRDVAGDACEQPDLGPHPLPFELHELQAVVARRVEDLGAVVDGGAFALERIDRRVGVHLIVETHGPPG